MIKAEIERLYNEYKIFGENLKKEAEKIQKKQEILDELGTDEEKLTNYFKDIVLKNGQFQYDTVKLLGVIETYLKYNNDLPTEIVELHEKYKQKPVFVIEGLEIKPFSQEYLEVCRKQVDNQLVEVNKQILKNNNAPEN